MLLKWPVDWFRSWTPLPPWVRLLLVAAVIPFPGVRGVCPASDEIRAGKHSAAEPQAGVPHAASSGAARNPSLAPDAVRVNANDIETIVVTPDGRPAAGAKVCLGFPRTMFVLINGKFDSSANDSIRLTSDRKGRLFMPGHQAHSYLAVTHPSGYAIYRPSPKSKLRRIVLDPWTRVEGRYFPGGKPRANAQVTITRSDLDGTIGDEGPQVVWGFEAKTGSDGRFVFERVPAGRGWIGGSDGFSDRRNDSATASAYMLCSTFPAGQILHLDIGTTGRSIVGKLRLRADLGKTAHWCTEPIRLVPKSSKEAYFRAILDRDGAFRIDDVPAGEYSLEINFITDNYADFWRRPISVPKPDGSGKPLDLGVLTLSR
jgi:hypothetical protein